MKHCKSKTLRNGTQNRDVSSVNSTDQHQHILQPHPKVNEIPDSDLISEVFGKNFSS